MKTKLFIFCLCVLAWRALWADGLPKVSLVHYGPESGLSQNTVNCILQDHKGMMWFGTYDGLNRFDGNMFKVFKMSKDNRIRLSSNHIKQMKEDRFGYIWLMTKEFRIFRFDPRTETSCQVPEKGEKQNIDIVSFEVFSEGDVWLLTKGRGVMRVQTDSVTHGLLVEAFLPRQNVSRVFRDRERNTWMLSDDGISCLREGEDMPISYLMENDFSFSSLLERQEEILFGSNQGEVAHYRKKDREWTFAQLPMRDRIVAIDSLSENELLFVTERKGFVIYNTLDGKLQLYDRRNCAEYPDCRILSAYYHAKRKEVWFEAERFGAVCYFNVPERKLHFQLIETEDGTAARTRPIMEDAKGNEWVLPYGGGFSYFDRGNGRFIPFYNCPNGPEQKYSNKLHSIFFDSQGNLWFCSHSKGLEKVAFLDDSFRSYQALPNSNSRTLDNDVRSIFEDKERRLWAGFRNRYVRVFDRHFHHLGYLTQDGRIAQNGLRLDVAAYAIMEDKNHTLWIATKGDGLLRLKQRGNNSYTIRKFTHNPKDIYSLSHDNVYALYEDTAGRIWIATFGGGLNYIDSEEAEPRFYNYRNRLKNYPIDDCPQIRHIACDGKGNIWLGTTNGALCFSERFEDAEKVTFRHIQADAMNEGSLSNNDVTWICSTSMGDLYLGTYGGGLNKLISVKGDGTPVFKTYTAKDGLTSDMLFAVLEDRAGHLWLSTEDRLSKFLPEKNVFETYNDNNYGFRLRFKEGAGTLASDNEIVFGSNQGLFAFCPDSIKEDSYVPRIVLSDLKIYDKVMPVGGKSPLDVRLDDTDRLVLSHEENNFTLHYAALDYRNPENIQYAYYLEGFDKNWRIADKQYTASYNNLPKGEYLFHVRSTNGDGTWVDNMRTLKIVVEPAFWESNVAYVLYALVALAIIMGLSHIRFVIYRLKHKVRVEQQITDIKLRFFTDISHEFRTPLTLISAPLEYVLENVALPDDGKKHLMVVKQNTDRMLRLVNQILDFRKIQNHKMKLVIQQMEAVAFVRKVMDNFVEMAENQKIDLRLEAPDNDVLLWADADKLEKILFNLLSNAFKFTPSGKSIHVVVREDEKRVYIEVHDQGIGIAEEKIGSIFNRFESLGNEDAGSQSNSSGIGLSLVKELVNMHKGTIEVESTPGEGSCFILSLLKGRSHYDERTEMILGGYERPAPAMQAQTEASSSEEPEALPEEDAKKLLIVEDNREMRMFLKDIFKKDYIVFEAVNGKDGFDKAVEIQPDLIISDVMMPEKDGIEMTKDIRESVEASHIPIILLTAKSTIESKLQGLEYGADAYVTKPFSTSYLRARVANLLYIRQKLYRALVRVSDTEDNQLQEGVDVVQEEKAQMTQRDRAFMEKLSKLVEVNLDNGELSIDDLAKEFPMSRSTFGNKVKALTGMATVKFILEVRLQKAVGLIREGELSFAQISYMVGFNDPHYFSKSFKQRFGISPTEYRQRLDKETGFEK